MYMYKQGNHSQWYQLSTIVGTWYFPDHLAEWSSNLCTLISSTHQQWPLRSLYEKLYHIPIVIILCET